MGSRHVVTQQILQGQAPPAVQEFAARGLLPIPRREFLDVWVYLRTHGSSAEIREQAAQALEALSVDELRAMLDQAEFAPETFVYLAERFATNPDIALQLVRNRAIPDDALEILARHSDAQVLEIIVTNQNRLLQSPHLVRVLQENPHLSANQRRRLMEFEEEFLRKGVKYELKKVPEPVPEPVIAPREAPPPVPPAETVPEVPPEVEEIAQEIVRDRDSGIRRLTRMSVAEKIMAALLGNREMRMNLVRDTNRVVLEAVVKSPKLTEAEAEAIASMRHLPSEILRILAERREFHRNRNFLYRIVTNPKTPIPVASRLLSSLTTLQLRDVARSRDVAAPIRQMARQRLKSIMGIRG